jgi:predicted MPP superfamily phosphohydrolase
MSLKSIVWLTDIHLNFVHSYDLEEFYTKIKDHAPTALFITGDIGEANDVFIFLEQLAIMSSAPVYFVLGNHDYYGGSIAGVRKEARKLTESDSDIYWMPARGVVELSEKSAVVGVDGWGDGRLGTPETSQIYLNDWACIKELMHKSPQSIGTHLYERIPALNRLGDEEAEALKPLLEEALTKYDKVFVLTHVPPWKEATWHCGAHSEPDWLPWFSCAAVGDVILELSHEYPDKEIVVLCGHTHGYGVSKISTNVTAYTGAAQYRFPVIQRVLESE